MTTRAEAALRKLLADIEVSAACDGSCVNGEHPLCEHYDEQFIYLSELAREGLADENRCKPGCGTSTNTMEWSEVFFIAGDVRDFCSEACRNKALPSPRTT